MRFINLTIKEGFFSKNFDFGDKTAIYSHINSVGKSTLLRLLFYSIGYSIPSTKKIRFDKLETILYLETVEGICEIYRKDKDIVLKCIDSETWKLRLPKDLEFILQKIFNIRNSDVLLNIIGAIYLDQDKGWTLLNRGTVIGGIKFKIDQLIQGMLNIEPLQALNVELEEVVEGISRLKQLKKIVDYQHENTTIIKESNFESTKLLDLEKNLSMIMGKISSLESEKFFNTENTIELFENRLNLLVVPKETIDSELSRLKNRKKELESIRLNYLSSELMQKIYENIMYFAKKLDVAEYLEHEKDFILTSDLKSYSGTILHKLVFCFKLAYIVELQKYLGFRLPIVLDSPSGREVDQKNIEDMFKILNEDFVDNQIIIASIFEYPLYSPDKIIKINKNLLE
ncbi:TPA: hypothetical protein ACYSYB_001914 [Streptococcus suis]